ncbi:porin family protein, partial [Mesonia mobilis]|uniref:porin family protein n=1 Tax=Mesonia mobilis TaxID=369791 RepID=UPI0026EEC10B
SLGGDAEDADSRTGLHIGAIAELMLTESFSIQPELLYSMQGAKSEYSDSYTEMGVTVTESGEAELKLDYIVLPILAKYYITEGFSVQAGPQVGFLMSAKAEGDYTATAMGTSVSESFSEDVKDELSTVDFGVSAGLGYDLDMGVFFQARYYLGLSNIYDVESDNFSVQNNVLQVSVGYKF